MMIEWFDSGSGLYSIMQYGRMSSSELIISSPSVCIKE